MKEGIGHVVVGNENIHEAVSIVVIETHAHALAEFFGDAGRAGNVGKSAVTVVFVERGREWFVKLRVTIGPQTSPAQTHGVLVDFPLAVVRNEQIQLAVVVVVDPARGRAPHFPALIHRCAHASLIGNIREAAVAIISIQMILRHAGDVNVLPAVVIEITDGDAHIVAVSRQPGLLGNIREGSVMIVVEQAVVVFRGIFFEGWNRRAINEEDVRVSVVVVVDETNA